MNKQSLKITIDKNKKKILVVTSIIILLLTITLFGKTLADPNSTYLRNQVIDGLSFENATLVYEDGITTFEVEVYNESDDIYSLKTININLKNEEGNITSLVGYIGTVLEKEEGKTITASIDKDLSDSISLEYIVNK